MIMTGSQDARREEDERNGDEYGFEPEELTIDLESGSEPCCRFLIDEVKLAKSKSCWISVEELEESR